IDNLIDPEAEVIALSPKSLLATNKIVLCEICSKGFQRDQNLQLHRRGHNLSWKLKQRSSKEPRKRVYVCPELSCVHHDPARALGDLTGIKKHFCRKHGEKRWKCERCTKKYAIQSDWKAHMKTCGTREYKCNCGTLFSRRDNFITHRAFCDALAEESIRSNNNAQTVTNTNPTTACNSEHETLVASPLPLPHTPSTTVVSPGNSFQSSDLADNPALPSPATTEAGVTNTSSTCTTSTTSNLSTTSNVLASSIFASATTSSSTFPPSADSVSHSFSDLLRAFTPSECPVSISTQMAMIEPPSLSLSPPPFYLSTTAPSSLALLGGRVGEDHYGHATMSATALLQKAA
ncbi:Zinc finger protein ENHYDROUS, partial [Linum perenne]